MHVCAEGVARGRLVHPPAALLSDSTRTRISCDQRSTRETAATTDVELLSLRSFVLKSGVGRARGVVVWLFSLILLAASATT